MLYRDAVDSEDKSVEGFKKRSLKDLIEKHMDSTPYTFFPPMKKTNPGVSPQITLG
jgi:hypothetical protein